MVKYYRVFINTYSGLWYSKKDNVFDTLEEAIAYVEANLKGEKVRIEEGIDDGESDIIRYKEVWTQEVSEVECVEEEEGDEDEGGQECFLCDEWTPIDDLISCPGGNICLSCGSWHLDKEDYENVLRNRNK
jgi:hypothetical protein